MEAYCCYKRQEFLIAKIGNLQQKNLLPSINMEIWAASSHLLVEVNIYNLHVWALPTGKVGWDLGEVGGGEGGNFPRMPRTGAPLVVHRPVIHW
jgi:hypothetical protein